MPKKKLTSRLKHNILMIAIAIIFALFIGYGIDTFYEAPEWEDYCDIEERIVDPANQTKLAEREQCEEEFDAVREPYERNVFIITLIIGMIAIIIGGVVLKVETVSSGIMGGGVFTLIYGTMRYWGDMHKYLRFTVLTIVLIVLIWIGYKKFKD
jgi:hypothetical protein